jgi:hypothetical protein
MASEANIAKRRADALNSIEASVSALAAKLNLPFDLIAKKTSDADFNILLRVENLASVLNVISSLDLQEKVKGKK